MKSLINGKWLTFMLTFILLVIIQLASSGQVPQGMNYQAIARDGSGNPLTGATLQVKISIQADTTTSPVIIWEELHNPVKTNAFGMFTLVIGTGAKQSGSATLFSDIDWSAAPLFIRTQIYYNSAWKTMGSAKLWSVPYSLAAGNVSGSLKKLTVTGTTTNMDSALFEVKNKTGQTIFAVYNEGIRAYVDNGVAKGNKGGFAIGGFGTGKAPSQNLMMISPDSARIYVDETAAKGNKGGFAIGGFNTAKGTVNEFMFLTPDNYFIGHNSGRIITTGMYNSTLGYESGKGLTEGSSNVFVGYQSGFTTDVGSDNVFVGDQAGYSNTSGDYNIILGRGAGYNSTTSWSNIFLGDLTAYNNETGYQNVMIGDWAGYYNTTGSQNVFLGAEAGWYNTTGSNNIFMGVNAGYHNTLGHDNIAIGNKADSSLLDGIYNVMIGSDAGHLNASGDYNTMIGYKAGEKTTGNWNTMLGYLAGNSTTTGGSQVTLGYQAGMSNTSGWNTMVGSLSGASSGNGTYNTYLGLCAGQYATGDHNVFLGRWAGRNESTNSNKLIIESSTYNGTDYSNNALIYGDFSAKYLKVNGDLTATDIVPSNDTPAILGQHNVTAYYGIGVKGIGGYLGVYGVSNLAGGTNYRYGVYGYATGGATNYGVYGYATGGTAYAGYFNGSVAATGWITLSSDKRLKKNILPLSGSLKKILELQGVTYEWKSEAEIASANLSKDEGKKESEPKSFNFPTGTQLGVIAQDVELIVPELVHTDANGFKSVEYIKLIPLLIESIKEQQKQIEGLKTLVNTLMTKQAK